MALQKINKSNQYVLTHNGVNYDLKYDPTTGEVIIIDTNASATTLPIYKDGNWTPAGNSLNINPQTLALVHSNTIDFVKKSHTSIGGNAKNAVLPPWVKNNSPAGATSSTPNSNSTSSNNGQGRGTGGVNNGPFGGIGNVLSAIGNLEDEAKALAVNGDAFGVDNATRIFATPMSYPLDLNVLRQDTFQITQYRYKPPRAGAVFGDPRKILSGGIPRESDFSAKQKIGMVFLPMPKTVVDKNSVDWQADSMNALSAAATASTLNDMAGTGLSAALGALVGNAGAGVVTYNLTKLITSGAISQELALLAGPSFASKLLKMGGYGVEAESILARGAGIIPNSNTELLFNGVTLRTFEFDYQLTARSEKEAREIRRIIRFFKQGMAAKKRKGKSGASSFFLGTPNVFKLEYMTEKTQLIEGVNRFKTCALKDFACNYTPNGIWAAYEKGQPIATTMKLSFCELEPIYDQDYQSSVAAGRNDLSAVSDTSIGY